MRDTHVETQVQVVFGAPRKQNAERKILGPRKWLEVWRTWLSNRDCGTQ